jgi:hypothetical protein
LSIASNIINIIVLIIQRYSFITTLFLGPFDDVITKFYCILHLPGVEPLLLGRRAHSPAAINIKQAN